jgi:hypothetical protein
MSIEVVIKRKVKQGPQAGKLNTTFMPLCLKREGLQTRLKGKFFILE